jgi:hypothetical protein
MESSVVAVLTPPGRKQDAAVADRGTKGDRGGAASGRRGVDQISLPSWIIGSSSLVFRSIARTIVRSSTPS